MIERHGLDAKAAKPVRKCMNYLNKNGRWLHYDRALAEGLPIATGVIEGACRHLIKDRMEQGGMRWTLTGAEAMLNVRAIAASDEWSRFGSWRQSEQADRLHPHRASLKNPTRIAA